MQKKILSYTAIFEPAEEGGYVVTVPALQGCMTQGRTFEEATANIREAIELVVECMRDDGEEIPVESEDTVFKKIRTPMPS